MEPMEEVKQKKLQWKSYNFPNQGFESPWLDEQNYQRLKFSLESAPDVYDIRTVEK